MNEGDSVVPRRSDRPQMGEHVCKGLQWRSHLRGRQLCGIVVIGRRRRGGGPAWGSRLTGRHRSLARRGVVELGEVDALLEHGFFQARNHDDDHLPEEGPVAHGDPLRRSAVGKDVSYEVTQIRNLDLGLQPSRRRECDLGVVA